MKTLDRILTRRTLRTMGDDTGNVKAILIGREELALPTVSSSKVSGPYSTIAQAQAQLAANAQASAQAATTISTAQAASTAAQAACTAANGADASAFSLASFMNAWNQGDETRGDMPTLPGSYVGRGEQIPANLIPTASGPNSGPMWNGFPVAYTKAQVAQAESDSDGAHYYAGLASASLAAANQAYFQILAAQRLGSLSASAAALLASQNPTIETQTINGYATPTSQKAITAGVQAAANQLTLELQAGNITQAQYNSAVAALTVPAQTS